MRVSRLEEREETSQRTGAKATGAHSVLCSSPSCCAGHWSMPGVTKPSSSRDRTHPAAACLRIDLRPRGLQRRTSKGDRSRPLIPKRLWKEIPNWIALFAERGQKKKYVLPIGPRPWSGYSIPNRPRNAPPCNPSPVPRRRHPRIFGHTLLTLPVCHANALFFAGAGTAARCFLRRTTAANMTAARSADAIRRHARDSPF